MSTLQTDRPASGARPGAARPQDSTPGRCANLDYCSIGMQRIQVQVPLGQAFVCPECGGPLRPPGLAARPGRPILLPLLRLAVLTAGMTAALIGGYAIGRMQPLVGTAVRSWRQAAVAQPPQAQPVAPVAPRPAPAPPPHLVIGRPYPARLPPVEVTNPPVHLAHESRFGQVTVDCTIAAGQISPACAVTDIRGGNTFSPAVLAWLQRLLVQYLPDPGAGSAAPPDHRWRILLQDFSGSLRAPVAPGR